jgi:hypothetical protein
VLADMLDGRPDTRPGLMFGFPAFYAAGKLVACVYDTGLGLRRVPRLDRHRRGLCSSPCRDGRHQPVVLGPRHGRRPTVEASANYTLAFTVGTPEMPIQVPI